MASFFTRTKSTRCLRKVLERCAAKRARFLMMLSLLDNELEYLSTLEATGGRLPQVLARGDGFAGKSDGNYTFLSQED